MNILFLTLTKIDDINQRGIYTDLLRQFINNGHYVFVVCPLERKYKQKTRLDKFKNCSILKVKTFNIQKTNIIEKAIGTLTLEVQYHIAINKYINNATIDLILYSTPPITLTNIISKIKKKFNSKTYLLLKDIFPQNAVDLGMMSQSGVLYRLLRRTEKKLYNISDFIGCMSPANVKYVINNNPEINPEIVEVCPNSLEILTTYELFDKQQFRTKYLIPKDSCVFVYGGNLGKPQGLDFLLDILKSNSKKKDRFFIIAGSGTEFSKIAKWFVINNPENALLFEQLPKLEFDNLVNACDVGLIFLDPRFIIPNYPSRLLSYLEYKMPVLIATDVNTDIGPIAEENGYGFWCVNGNLHAFNDILDRLASNKDLRIKMGEKGYQYLLSNYQVQLSSEIILSHFSN